MCSRLGLHPGLQPFLERLGVLPEAVAPPPPDLTSGRPTEPAAVGLRNPRTKRLEVRYPRWGLVPSWSTGPPDRDRRPLLHARAETIAELASFREPFRRRRGVMPMVGFHESNRADRTKYLFSMADGSVMGAAAVWDYRRMEDGSTLVSCAMVTCAANELVAKVHGRMPAILAPGDYPRWLDPDLDDPEELSAMLRPMDAGLMAMEPLGMGASARKTPPAKEQALLFS